MEKKLEVKNLQVSFRTQGGILKAVRNISFDLYKGETFAIVGESGSGKSVTSKSIMGILSGNSIVEGGEILYDGQDLLKISEEDFHKIRGDKIAMIFQDPMSSLNPIMRVGKQLTEAMLLKTKTSRKNARDIFNSTLKLLNENIDEVPEKSDPETKKKTNLAIHTFDNFCIESTKVEGAYNNAQATIIDLNLQIENDLFLIEKHQKVNIAKNIADIRHKMKLSLNPYVLVMNDEVTNLDKHLAELAKLGHNAKVEEFVSILKELQVVLKKAEESKKPNFFRMGYYLLKNPDADLSKMPIDELDQMTLKYLDENYMIDFINLGAIGIKNSHDKSMKIKKELLVKLNEAKAYFEQETISHEESVKYYHELSQLVKKAIDKLDIVKNSSEYTFESAFKTVIHTYFAAVKHNPVEQARYEHEKAKYDHLIEIGKAPDWKLVPAKIVDLDLAKQNIVNVINGLINSIEKDVENDQHYNPQEKMVQLIDYLKEQASKVVQKMTHKMAKAKALKLLEEVGIPEPAIRFNQYPFEFSGGMRQRIVIAIALSADPDILICDEPTTALDVTIQAQILELINRLKAERHLSVIFITHNLGVVANMADRIAVMYAGKIVEYGTADDIFYDPRHPYTWALLSSMPDLETKDKLEAITGTPPNMIYPPVGDAFAERNKYALEIDFEKQPPLFKVSDSHYAATWLLHPNAPKVELPKLITMRIERMKKEKAKNGEQ